MKSSPKKTPLRADGREKFVVYLPPALIRAIKVRALDEKKHAYELVEELLEPAFSRSPIRGE